MSGTFYAPGKWVLAIVVFAWTSGAVCAQQEPLAKRRLANIEGKQYLLTSRLKSILIGEFTYSFTHIDGPRNLDSTIVRLGRAEGWRVDWISTGVQVTPDKLADHQVFFGNYISDWTSREFPVAGRLAIQDFVENQGNGVFLMHSSDAVSMAWEWFRTSVLPCHFAGEAGRNISSTGKVGVFRGYQSNPSAVGHPILEGIGWDSGDSTVWTGNELHYFDTPILDPSITPAGWQGLLSLNTATCGTPNTCGIAHNYATGTGGNYPLSWTFPLQKGNIGFFMEGHDLATMTSITQPVWDRFFKQFLYYIAGYDTVEVATAIHHPGSGNGDDLSYALDRSGITFHPLSQPGVLITKAGNHIVALYDLSGKKIREERGHESPIDYDFSSDLAGKHGVYVLRVAASGLMRSRRFVF